MNQPIRKKPAADIQAYFFKTELGNKCATRLMKNHQGSLDDNPTTSVGLLVDRLRRRIQEMIDRI